VRAYDKTDPNTKSEALRKLLNPQERMLSELTTFRDPNYTAKIEEGDKYRAFLLFLLESEELHIDLSPNLTWYLYCKMVNHAEFGNIQGVSDPHVFKRILDDIRQDVFVQHSLALIFERYADYCKDAGNTGMMLKMIEKSLSCWIEVFNQSNFYTQTYTWKRFAGSSREEICLQVWKNFIGRIPENSYEQFKSQLSRNQVNQACIYLNTVKKMTSYGELAETAGLVMERMLSDLIREADAIFFRGKVKTGYTGDYDGVFACLCQIYARVGNIERLLLYEAGKQDSYLFELRTTKSFETSYYHIPAIKELERRLSDVKAISSQPFNIEHEIKNLYDRLQDLAVDSINDSKYRLAIAIMKTLTGNRTIKVGYEYKTIDEVIRLCEQMAIQTGDYWKPKTAPAPQTAEKSTASKPQPVGSNNYSSNRYQTIPQSGIYAGFWRRFAASFIDGIILLIADLILEAMGWPGITFIIVSWLYFAISESSMMQGTIGKRIMGIQVTDMNCGRIKFGKATGRYFGKFISGAVFLIGYFMAGFTEKKQALHDIMASTLVVKKYY